MDRKFCCMLISETSKTLRLSCRTTRAASACSEASLSILSRITIQQRRSSSVSTNRQQRRWRENASSSVPSISVPINSAIISRWKKRRTRHLAAVRSASAWRGRRSSRHSFARCSAQAHMEKLPLCIQWSQVSARFARSKRLWRK